MQFAVTIYFKSLKTHACSLRHRHSVSSQPLDLNHHLSVDPDKGQTNYYQSVPSMPNYCQLKTTQNEPKIFCITLQIPPRIVNTVSRNYYKLYRTASKTGPMDCSCKITHRQTTNNNYLCHFEKM